MTTMMSNATGPGAGPAPVVLAAGRLRLVFTWRGDRWEHAVESHPAAVSRDAPAERVTDRIASIEGTAADDWPASPPWQSLHVEQRGPGRQVAFLVGMAGASHWSASIELDAASEAILFDVACRVKATPTQLGSGYRGTGCRMEPVEVDGVVSRCLTAANDEQRIEPPPATGPWPQTIRWRYTVSMPL